MGTKILAVVFLISAVSSVAMAQEAKPTGQNAFTRAVKGPLASIVTPVPNPHNRRCNSVVECRKFGGDLETVWQLNNSFDHSPRNYPANCYIANGSGQYIYSATACR